MLRVLTTLEEANGASPGTAVVNGYGEIYQKNKDGLWYSATSEREPTLTEALFYGISRKVLWVPGDLGIPYQDIAL